MPHLCLIHSSLRYVPSLFVLFSPFPTVLRNCVFWPPVAIRHALFVPFRRLFSLFAIPLHALLSFSRRCCPRIVILFPCSNDTLPVLLLLLLFFAIAPSLSLASSLCTLRSLLSCWLFIMLFYLIRCWCSVRLALFLLASAILCSVFSFLLPQVYSSLSLSLFVAIVILRSLSSVLLLVPLYARFFLAVAAAQRAVFSCTCESLITLFALLLSPEP